MGCEMIGDDGYCRCLWCIVLERLGARTFLARSLAHGHVSFGEEGLYSCRNSAMSVAEPILCM